MKALSSALLQLTITTLHNKQNNVVVSTSYEIHFKIMTCLQSLNVFHMTITVIRSVLHAYSHKVE
jgi:hypothetical protein